MSYINVDEAYILDNTGVQVDKTVDLPFKNAGLTDAQKAQARKNIAAGGTNPNLLQNPFFSVNQRGQSSYASNGYTVDRWRTTNSNGTVTVNSNGVTLAANSNGNAFLVQYTSDGYEGVYTYSAYIKGSGAGYIAVTNADRSTVLSSKSFDNVGSNWTLISGTFTTSGTAIGTFTIRANSGTSIDIKSVKLEYGSCSTLANDATPDYWEELAKCQRYFYRVSLTTQTDPFAVGIAYSGGLRFLLPIGKMRATPTIAATNVGAIAIRGDGVSGATVTGLTVITQNELGVYLEATTSTSLTSYKLYAMTMTSNNAIIDLSADL